MPRTVSVNMRTHFGLPEKTYIPCWRVYPRTGGVECFTALDVPLNFGGQTFDSTSNMLPAAVPATIGLEVDGVDVTLLFSDAEEVDALALDRDKVEARFYDGALVELFVVNWAAVLAGTHQAGEDEIYLMAGRLGRAEIIDEAAKFGLVPLSEVVNATQGRITGDRCDCARFGRGRCTNLILLDGIKIVEHGRTVAGSVVVPGSFEPNGMHLWLQLTEARPDGWANWGVLRFTSGANAGAELPVKTWKATGEIFLRVPVPEIPEVGDTFELEEGCEHTRAACLTKEPDPNNPTGKGNILNFQGFNSPGQNKLVNVTDG